MAARFLSPIVPIVILQLVLLELCEAVSQLPMIVLGKHSDWGVFRKETSSTLPFHFGAVQSFPRDALRGWLSTTMICQQLAPCRFLCMDSFQSAVDAADFPSQSTRLRIKLWSKRLPTKDMTPSAHP